MRLSFYEQNYIKTRQNFGFETKIECAHEIEISALWLILTSLKTAHIIHHFVEQIRVDSVYLYGSLERLIAEASVFYT